MRHLAVTDHRWLAFADGTLADVDPERPVGQVVDLLDGVAPDTVLTFGPDGMTFHSDHIAVHEWVAEAWRRRGRPCRLLCAALEQGHMRRHSAELEMWGVSMTGAQPQAVEATDLALHLVLDDALLDRKMAALAAMPSQTADVPLPAGGYREINRVESFVAVP